MAAAVAAHVECKLACAVGAQLSHRPLGPTKSQMITRLAAGILALVAIILLLLSLDSWLYPVVHDRALVGGAEYEIVTKRFDFLPGADYQPIPQKCPACRDDNHAKCAALNLGIYPFGLALQNGDMPLDDFPCTCVH